jgi:hypothetical protein
MPKNTFLCPAFILRFVCVTCVAESLSQPTHTPETQRNMVNIFLFGLCYYDEQQVFCCTMSVWWAGWVAARGRLRSQANLSTKTLHLMLI